MTPETERRALEVLERLLEAPAAERAAMLAVECADDAALRTEVESLLGAAAPSAFLERPLNVDPATLAEAAGAAPSFATVGPYRLMRELGHGGMGAVYLATRMEDGFAHQVAVKLIRRGMDSEVVQRRFRAERQILADLQHPNIARLFDGGSTPDGAPYFVMEYVDGRDLLRWCDSHQLPTRRRIEIFREVCAAVHFAHQRLIVHRDLKPGNILVGEDGIPKLLDFGLARVLDPTAPEAETADVTAFGMRFFTPEYASPEQVRGGALSTATDIYSLGVILYELLSGRRPYELPSRRPAEVERAVCGAMPERPSAVVERTAAASGPALAPEVVSRARDASPAGLRRALAGDLDNIVLKALRKEPERRYASVEQLSEDLRRYLAGLPVSARPGTLGYRTRKFVRRHLGAVVAVTVFGALLAVVVAKDNARLRRERDRAEQVSAFLGSLFRDADPDHTKGARLTATEVLDRGAARLGVGLTDQPAIKAEMELLIGDVYSQLSVYPPARVLFEDALATRRRLFGAEALETARAEYALGVLLHRLAADRESRVLLEHALAVQQREGEDDARLARTLSGLALTVRGLGDYEGAYGLLMRALRTFGRREGPPTTDEASALNNLGIILQRTGRHPGARMCFECALRMHETLSGPQSPAAAQTLGNLGSVLRNLKDYAGARAAIERSLAIEERALGPEHRSIAVGFNDLGNLLNDMGEGKAAGAAYERSLAVFEKALGADHPDVAWPLRGLGSLARASGDLKAALSYYERALAIRRKAYGPDHRDTGFSLLDVGIVRSQSGDRAGGEGSLRQAIEVARKVEGGDRGALLADCLESLGVFLLDWGRPAEAAGLLEESVGIYGRIDTPGNSDRRNAEVALARARSAAGSGKGAHH